MSVGRNEPCPCGSGRKYKKCHLPIEQEAGPRAREERVSPLHSIDHELVMRILEWAIRRFGGEAELETLAVRFPEVASGGLPFMASWSVYHYAVRGLPLFEWYAREQDAELSRRDREWIEAQRRSWMSVWEVRASIPGKSMVLSDLLTGEQRLVQEATASRTIVARDVILTRVVDLGNDSVLVGLYPQSLPPIEGHEVAARFAESLGAEPPLSPDRLRDPATVHRLIQLWDRSVDDLDARRSAPPKLRNSDMDGGDDAAGEPDLSDEGFVEFVREQKRRHYAAWPDRALPALGNRTPRDAARSGDSRDALALLLKEMENREAREPAVVRFDFHVLRRTLGIEE